MIKANEPRYQEINIGGLICAKLKDVYFKEVAWSTSCYEMVGHKFTEIKKRARQFYADKSEIEMLQELAKLSGDELQAFMEPVL